MADSIGSVCTKKECEGTEYVCACQKCEAKNEVRSIVASSSGMQTFEDAQQIQMHRDSNEDSTALS
jgi:hypothetical protein